MAEYAWKITRDHLEGEDVSIYGPRDMSDAQRAALDTPTSDMPVSNFRMYDDDRELYFSGVFVGGAESEDGFGPLDDYGKPDSGCTEIRYRQKSGKWETL